MHAPGRPSKMPAQNLRNRQEVQGDHLVASWSSPVRLLLVLTFLLLSPAAALAQDFERWYTLEMAGQRAGYMHSLRTTEGDRITSETKMVMNVSRGPVAISVTMSGQFVETAAGKPVSMTKIEQMGAIPSRTEYIFDDQEIVIRTFQGDQVVESRRPQPEGNWLTPGAAQVYLRKRLAAGADAVVVRTMDPLSGHDPLVINRTGVRPMNLDVMSRTIEVFRCNAESSSTPGVNSTEYLDASGIPVRLTMSVAGIPMVVMMSDRQTALGEGAAGAELGPEMMERTFIRPNRQIRSPRRTTSAQYILSIAEGEMPILPQTGSQKVETIDGRPGAARVIINTKAMQAANEAYRKDPVYLESSALLNADDPEIRKLVEKAAGAIDKDPEARAEEMRRFVFRFIHNKDLDVAFASASEVARSRQGDCTEHAVLLAAMLRAGDIPARVVSGLVYADQFAGSRHIFGYHMWTQALLEIDGQDYWVDLDATLPRAFDATHIALSVSALRDGEMATSLSSMLPLIGQLEIKVESYE